MLSQPKAVLLSKKKILDEVCIESPLNEITGEKFDLRTANTSNEARLDISARGVWTKGQRAFFDIRVFDSSARRYKGLGLPRCYQRNENEKKRNYNERILQIENGSFTQNYVKSTLDLRLV